MKEAYRTLTNIFGVEIFFLVTRDDRESPPNEWHELAYRYMCNLHYQRNILLWLIFFSDFLFFVGYMGKTQSGSICLNHPIYKIIRK